jgi:tetratricopeptide (TPR) repeat protein
VSVSAHSSASSSSTSGTFVGRDEELRALQSCLRDALAGTGRLVTLVGDGGIGKTRTTEELIARSGLPPDRVLWGRCPEQDGAPAYWPWAQALRTHVYASDTATLRADLGAGAADVARVVPAVRERLPDLEGPYGLDPTENRFRVFESVAAFLRRVAARTPLVLVLDDLHWADPGSLLLLQAIAPDLRGVRMLVVGTYREQEMGRVPGALADLARVSMRVTLRGLRAGDVRAFIRATAGVAASEALVDDLHRTTEGNPFFLDELVRMLGAEGGLDAEGLGPTIRLPEEVRTAIRRHLAPLGPEDRRLLTLAAVMGREFELAALQTACERSAAWVLERLAVAADARIVAEVRGTLGRYRFAHALIRETLYGDLAPATRAQTHRQVALALEAQGVGDGGAPLGELAHHFYHAARLGEAGKAGDYALRAAREATATLAYEEAVDHFDRALQCFALEPPDERRQLGLRLELGNAYYAAGARAKAREVFAEAATRARALGDAESLTMAALGYGWATTEPGVVDATLVGLLEQALATLSPDHAALHATLEGRLAIALYFSDEVARRDALSRSSLERARASGDPGAVCMALIVRQLTQWGPDVALAERSALLDEASALAAHPELVLEARVWRVECALEAGDLAVADRELERIARGAEAQRARTYLWHARLIRAARALMAGRYDDGGRLAGEALALRPEGQLGVPSQFYCVQTFQRLRDVGGVEELEAPLVLFGQSFPAVPIWRCGLALLYAESGQETKARAVLDQLAARRFADIPRDGNIIPALLQLAEVVVRLGDRERAEWLYALLAPHAGRHAVIAMSAACYGAAGHGVGILAALLGRTDEAVSQLRRALEMNEVIGARPFVARTQLALARALHTRAAGGDGDEAATLVAEARATAAALGMHALVDRIDDVPAPVTVPVVASAMTTAVLRRDADGWIVTLDGHEARLRDARGLGYLSTLLAHPEREFHALDLEGGEDDPVGGVLDGAAREAYARRLADLRDELAEAEAFNDTGRAEQAAERLEELSGELAGRVQGATASRRAGAAAERARVNVTRAIARAVERVAAVHPVLGQHLTATLRTGAFCCYAPDPRLPLRWQL